jgi:hypothetical protein
MHLSEEQKKKAGEQKEKNIAKEDGGKDRTEGDLTNSEQIIPIAKHAMKPFILVPQLNEDDSTT